MPCCHMVYKIHTILQGTSHYFSSESHAIYGLYSAKALLAVDRCSSSVYKDGPGHNPQAHRREICWRESGGFREGELGGKKREGPLQKKRDAPQASFRFSTVAPPESCRAMKIHPASVHYIHNGYTDPQFHGKRVRERERERGKR